MEPTFNTQPKPSVWLLALLSSLVMISILLETLWDAELTTLEHLLPVTQLSTAHTLDQLEVVFAELAVKLTAPFPTLLAPEPTTSTPAMLHVMPPAVPLPLTELPPKLTDLLFNAELTTLLLLQSLLTPTSTAPTLLLTELMFVEPYVRTIAL
jgi:hypothetical protein